MAIQTPPIKSVSEDNDVFIGELFSPDFRFFMSVRLASYARKYPSHAKECLACINLIDQFTFRIYC
jgi:hypothetical protein